MNRAAIIVWLLAVPALGQELWVRDTPAPVKFSRDKQPATAISDAAKRQAKKWLAVWSEDKPKGWKATGWEYRGSYSGPGSNGKRLTYYRLSFNPPIADDAGSPHFEMFFGFDGERLAVPSEEYSRSLPPPRAPAIVEMPPSDRQVKR